MITNLCFNDSLTVHSLHRRKASQASCATSEDVTRKRLSRGRRNSEDGVQGGGVALHSLSLHCDPWPWQGPYRHWCGRLVDLNWKAIFLYHGDHVCNNTNRVPTARLTTRDFFLHGYTDGQKRHRQNTVNSFFSFCPHTVTEYGKATPYSVSMQYWPLLSPMGDLCDSLTPMVVGIIS